MRFLIAFLLGSVSVGGAVAAEKIPLEPLNFISDYCLDCHDAGTAKGDIDLDFLEIDWASADQATLLDQVHRVIADGEMPPPKKKNQPETVERESILQWIDASLTKNIAPGGTPLRRLNRTEYVNSINQIFGIGFKLPPSFPPDTRLHGFDNQGEGLVLSPPLLEAYAESAAVIADELFPPPLPVVEKGIFDIRPTDMAISYSSGKRVGGAMRLGCKSAPMSRSCSWPTKFETKGSGTYKIQVQSTAFNPRDDQPLKLQIRARPLDANDGTRVDTLRLLGEFDVRAGDPQTFEFSADLYRGETLVYYFANAELDSDNEDKNELRSLLEKMFTDDKRLLAAWMSVEHNQGLRGGVGWKRVKTQLARDDLDLSIADPQPEEAKKMADLMIKNPVNYVETLIYQYFDQGPALDIRKTTIEGPFESVEDPATKAQKRRRADFLGEQGTKSESDWIAAAIEGFLTKAFRRPASPEWVAAYHRLFDDHRASGHDFDAAMHLVVRTALTSPNFLYRDKGEGQLDDFEFASRLSYFLTSGPPDNKLRDAALGGRMSIPKTVLFQADRLLNDGANQNFVRSFTQQWLGLHALTSIMPDPKLGRFRDSDRKALEQEAEMFLAEMIRENRPLTDFIAPDFTYTSPDVGSAIYGLKFDKAQKKKGTQMLRVSLNPNSPHGGILGQAGVMMATANGVDTQPVLRGVWVLENVLGDPPPPPPEAVPAITPDTRGAKTIRDLMAAHTSEESCARCHQKIDPLGFVLENFNPIGQWREAYPAPTPKAKTHPIDATGTLPDGTALNDVRDLKRYIVEHIDQFGNCLAEKFFTYGTGRAPNYTEHKQLQTIVDGVLKKDGGTRDLLLGIIGMEAFRAK